MKSWPKPEGYLVVAVPWNEIFEDYLYSRDYAYHKEHYGLDSKSSCHITFGITEKALNFVLPGTKFVKRYYPIRFRKMELHIFGQ